MAWGRITSYNVCYTKLLRGLIPTRVVRFQYMKVGPYQIDHPMAMVIDHKTTEVNFDGLLGMDFLRNLNYRIDYDRQIIRWQPELGE